MRNAVKLAANKTDSPKTAGGISKSHLTPIRRLGLSRNWRKTGSSPFISPLSGSNNVKDVTPTINENRKRKEPVEDVQSDEESKAAVENKTLDGLLDIDENDTTLIGNKSEDIVGTPIRTASLSRKKKLKILKPDSENYSENSNIPVKQDVSLPKLKSGSKMTSPVPCTLKSEDCDADDVIEKYVEVSKPKKSKSRTRKNTKQKELDKTVVDSLEVKAQVHVDAASAETTEKTLETKKSPPKKEKSPKELTKECIVVIQKKIFKNELNEKNEINLGNSNKDLAAPSQVLFDSDSDEVPLSYLNKNKLLETVDNAGLIAMDDDDFIEPRVKIKKLENKTTSTTGLKTNSISKSLQKTAKPKIDNSTQGTQNTDVQDDTFDDDDDFQIHNKRTILIRKSYDKVSKLSKARSTGSITQKDIDELKARIEMKKKLLMAKSVNKDTEELRGLIKKWQKGCQEALTELMDLMKMKFPDKRNMDYSEILETLKIPANLVGYDSDNDCFVTPTDESIILSKLNDM